MLKNILIVGCGPVGIAAANVLSNKNYKVKILDSRNHIGGNCYDFYNEKGILVHKYGPHYFRTNDEIVFQYLSQFTKWIHGNYQVKSIINNQKFDFPINLNTLEQFYNKPFNKITASKYFNSLPRIKKQDNFESYLINKIGKDLYENFYKGYTLKQWNKKPHLLSAEIAKRIPIRFDRNKNYFDAKYMFMPKDGFTYMFRKMLDNKNIEVELSKFFNPKNCNINQFDKIIYTGPIDRYFNYIYGKLDWRSLLFKFKTYKENFKQTTVQYNYPNDYLFTRKVEYKHVTKQNSKFTTISEEYPKDKGEPYYPVYTSKNFELYNKYKKLTKKISDKVYFVGRLAEYTYINTDQAILKGINIAEKIISDKK